MILDGELVAFDAAGRPSFGAMQDRFQLKSAADIARADQRSPVVFFAFDLLYFAGIDLRRAPTPSAAAISRNACFRRRSCSSCTPRTTAWRFTPRRWRRASKA